MPKTEERAEFVCALCSRTIEDDGRRYHGLGVCRFPIQSGLTISTHAAVRAWAQYRKHYGLMQSMLVMAQRGGFGLQEFVDLYFGGNGSNKRSDVDITRALMEADVRSTHPV